MTGPLQQSMKQLGLAAVTQAAKMAELSARGDLRKFEAVILEHMFRVTRAAIAFTAQLIIASNLGTPEKARELEEKLVASLDGAVDNSADYQEAVESLVASARSYANSDGHEQTHKLARAAVTFTLQLTIACGTDQDAFRETARTMEMLLVAKLDEVFAPPKDLS